MAPISLVLLNPLGFLCMEIGERKKENRRLSQLSSAQHTANPSVVVEPTQALRKISSISTTSLSSVIHKKSNGCKVKIYKC